MFLAVKAVSGGIIDRYKYAIHFVSVSINLCKSENMFSRIVIIWGISPKTQDFSCGRFGYSTYYILSEILYRKPTKLFIVAGMVHEGILCLILIQWKDLSSKDLKVNECRWVVSFKLRPIYPTEIKPCVRIQIHYILTATNTRPSCMQCG